jgi:hypothetical protein
MCPRVRRYRPVPGMCAPAVTRPPKVRAQQRMDPSTRASRENRQLHGSTRSYRIAERPDFACALLAASTCEGVDGVGQLDINEAGARDDCLPPCTRQGPRDSTSPEGDVSQCIRGHRPLKTDVCHRALRSVRVVLPADLAEEGVRLVHPNPPGHVEGGRRSGQTAPRSGPARPARLRYSDPMLAWLDFGDGVVMIGRADEP